jgi:cytoskeletal protein RodZ
MQPQQPYQQMPQYPGYQQQPVQRKKMNGLLIPLVICMVLMVVFIALFVWAFASRQDYKNNSDKKAAAAAEIAKQQTSSAKDKEFVEKEKLPVKTYKGPSSYGTLSIAYPKTWSAYIDESGQGNVPVNGYFHPEYVPGLQSGSAFALRVQVTNQKYADEIKQFESKIKTGKVTLAPYQAPMVTDKNAVGARITGEIENGKQGSIVLFPLRDKTVKISTESTQFINDFEKIILANLTFVP